MTNTDPIRADRPVSRQVARNLVRLRKQRQLTVRALSARLAELGRPLLPSAISKIETGGRRVDVDDLVALAAVLDVPVAQLLTDAAGGFDSAAAVEARARGALHGLRDVIDQALTALDHAACPACGETPGGCI
jgi:transcriptional regulator with XRE-family HTH domain